MTEETQFPTPEPAVPTPPASDASPASPKKSNKSLWVILAVVATVLMSCLCIMLCLGTVGAGLWKASAEAKPVQAVLDAYMKAMAAKDVDSAYDLFSPRIQKTVTPAKLREMLQGNNYVERISKMVDFGPNTCWERTNGTQRRTMGSGRTFTSKSGTSVRWQRTPKSG